jgi:signal peptidase I
MSLARPPSSGPEEPATEALPPPVQTQPATRQQPQDTTPPEAHPDGKKPVAKKPEKEGSGVLGFFKELPGLIIIAFVLALLIKSFLIQAFFIPSQSMVPTLLVGDRVLVNKLVFDFGDVQRGDIVVFENPHLDDPDRNPLAAFWNWLTEGLGFSSDPEKDFIKRVVGLPGETIEITKGQVFIDGERIQEPYLNPHALRDRSDLSATLVKPDHLFVMGDNRPNSQASRSSLGQIPLDKVVGKAFVLLWPPSRIEWLSDD